MLVKELIEKLRAKNPEAEVIIAYEYEGDYCADWDFDVVDPRIFGKGDRPPNWPEDADFTETDPKHREQVPTDRERVQISTYKLGREAKEKSP